MEEVHRHRSASWFPWLRTKWDSLKSSNFSLGDNFKKVFTRKSRRTGSQRNSPHTTGMDSNLSMEDAFDPPVFHDVLEDNNAEALFCAHGLQLNPPTGVDCARCDDHNIVHQILGEDRRQAAPLTREERLHGEEQESLVYQITRQVDELLIEMNDYAREFSVQRGYEFSLRRPDNAREAATANRTTGAAQEPSSQTNDPTQSDENKLRERLTATISRTQWPNLIDADLTNAWQSWRARPTAFNLKRRTNVKLVNSDGTSMGAIDGGGPSRQFMTNLMAAIADMDVFVGDWGHKTITTLYKCLEDKTYFHIGAALALTLTAGGPLPTFLGPITSSIISRDMASVKGSMTIADLREAGIIDPKMAETFRRIQASENLEQLQTVITEMEVVSMASYGNYVARDLERDKKEILDSIIHYVIVGRHGWAYSQLFEGLAHVQDILKEFPKAFDDYCHTRPLSAEQLITQLRPRNNTSNNQKLEERALRWFCQFIRKLDEGKVRELNLGDLMEAMTGLKDRNVMAPAIDVKFLDSKLPRFDTCVETVTLPLALDTYQNFHEGMWLGMMGSKGFISDHP